jgi:prepilin-type processing-associated H-X9-DG protein
VTNVTTPPTVNSALFYYGFNNRLDANFPMGQYKRTIVKYPVLTVTITEGQENGFPSTSGVFTPARHTKSAMLAFVDGHAAATTTNDFRRTTAQDGNSVLEYAAPRKVYWYPFDGAPP